MATATQARDRVSKSVSAFLAGWFGLAHWKDQIIDEAYGDALKQALVDAKLAADLPAAAAMITSLSQLITEQATLLEDNDHAHLKTLYSWEA